MVQLENVSVGERHTAHMFCLLRTRVLSQNLPVPGASGMICEAEVQNIQYKVS